MANFAILDNSVHRKGTQEDLVSCPGSVDLRRLIGHSASVRADQTVVEAFQSFSRHGVDFMAVLQEDKPVGLCSKRDIGMLLGSQYGFSLFSQKAIRQHTKRSMVCIKPDTPIQDVFNLIFAREGENFYDDILLVGEDRKLIGLISTQTLIKLQNTRHLQSISLLDRQRREIELKNAQIEADLRMSRELQLALLPDVYPAFPAHATCGDSLLRFSHYYRPCGFVGGDFFHVKRVNDFSAGVFIADVMGHGVRASLITVMLRALLEEMDEEFEHPGRLLGTLNRKLCKILAQTGDGILFATAFYLLADSAKRRLSYADSGHPLPLYLGSEHGQAEFLAHPEPGAIMGVFEDAEFATAEVFYKSGDKVILYTDGLIDMEDDYGEPFGQERILETARLRATDSVPEIFQALLDDAHSFAGNREFQDDICMFAVELF